MKEVFNFLSGYWNDRVFGDFGDLGVEYHPLPFRPGPAGGGRHTEWDEEIVDHPETLKVEEPVRVTGRHLLEVLEQEVEEATGSRVYEVPVSPLRKL